MTGIEIGLISVLAMLLLIYFGMYVPVVLALLSFLGVLFIRGDFIVATDLLVLSASKAVSDFLFGVIPLFVLMGLLVGQADLARDTYQVANAAFRKLRGGLGIATVVANAIFAAITGISIASAAVFSRVAVPEMLNYGYNKRFAVGVVAGSSVLGMLIPPSILLIIYAILTEQSVGDMFIAGVMPGILLSAVFCIGILLCGYIKPSLIQPLSEKKLVDESIVELSWGEIFGKLFPVVSLIVVVLGGIYGGIFTPTEAGAAGAFGALVIALLKRKLTFSSTWRILVETGHVTATVLFLIIGATMYSRMLGMSGLPTEIQTWILGMDASFVTLIIFYILLMILLGTVIDSVSVMLITVPLFVGVLQPFGIDLIWFGIITVIGVEIGLLTPPMGISVYVIKSSLNDARISLWDIFAGAAPFALAMLFVLILIILFPEIVTFLVYL
jgi:tripartite ATP-independent transporter DctM subunit